MNMVAKTDRGRIRESNQDAYFVGEMPDGTAFAVVCDGMGGAAGGNIASSLAVQVISSKINASYHPNMRDSSICNMLESALSAANVEVYDLAQVTTDHSMVQDLLESGKITPDEAKHHPNKNIITRAIGVDSAIKIDFDQIDFSDGQVLLLCTDGLSNYVDNDEMVSAISDGQYYAYADRLVQQANKNGGGDNITVVAISN